MLPSMFPESNESDLCARPVGNLVNHQASGALQYHQAGGTLGVLCGSYFFYYGCGRLSKGDILGYVGPQSATKCLEI